MSNSGVTGALPYNPLDYCVLSACTALAWAFAIELQITVIAIFRRRNGLYFWSLVISAWGCILHALGFIFKFLVGTSPLIYLAFIEIGWVAMVTGQAFVLFSRLNLVLQNKSVIRGVLAMIIIDAIALHVPILVFIYGANSSTKQVQDRWIPRFNVMERIQLLGFSLQETIIGGIYIIATLKLLTAVYYERTRRAMLQLLAVNCICIGMDIILVGLEFSNNYFGEASAKPLIYAIKLKLEFAVYSQLVGLTKATLTMGQSADPGSQHNRPINTPADFFKNIPGVIEHAPTPIEPTKHTHPEQFQAEDKRYALERPNLKREWGSDEIELTANSLAAALTADGTGGRGGKSAKKFVGGSTEEKRPSTVRRRSKHNVKNQEIAPNPHSESVPKEWSGIYQA